MKEVAVIMSVYQGDKLLYVKEALESLYSQTMCADIFIYQDGNIPYELEEYLNRELSNDRIVHLEKHTTNRGLACSMNVLLNIILDKYEYIMRMDADDISMQNRISLQYNFLERHKDIDVVGGYIEEFSSDMEYRKVVQYPLSQKEMFDFFAKRVPLAHVTAYFRRRFFQKAGYYTTTTLSNEDTLLWMQGFKHKAVFANIPEVLVNVRVSQSFFGRRGGIAKAWSDFKDRVLVIKTLGYNTSSYFYAIALFFVNIAPSKIKQFLYKRLR